MKDMKLFLDKFSSDALKVIASALGVEIKRGRKPDFINALAPIFFAPERIKKAIAKLPPEQMKIMQYLKPKKRPVYTEALREIFLAEGRKSEEVDDALRALSRLGFCYTKGGSYGGSMFSVWRKSQWEDNKTVETFPEILKFIAEPAPSEEFEELEGKLHARQRPFDEVMKDMLSFVEYIEKKTVRLTKTGLLPKKDRDKIGDTLKIPEWFALLYPTLKSANLVKVENGKLRPTRLCKEFFRMSIAEQAKKLFEGWIKQDEFDEFERVEELEINKDELLLSEKIKSARAIAMEVLKKGVSYNVWHSVGRFSDAVKRFDVEFLILRVAGGGYWYSSRGEHRYRGVFEKGKSSWNSNLDMRKDWGKVEGRFLKQILEEPLFWFGLVSLGHDKDGELVGLRLTDVGAYVFGIAEETSESTGEKTLIVQPNFDLILHTEKPILGLRFQIERFADKVSGDKVFVYRLNRESIYRGIQSGMTLDEILDILQNHSRNEIPQNVIYSIRDWVASFERIHIWRDSLVVEAESKDELDKFLQGTLPDEAVTHITESIALVDKSYREAVLKKLSKEKNAGYFDYWLPAGRIFTVTEGLNIIIKKRLCDWLSEGEIESFAEAVNSDNSQSRAVGSRESGLVYRITRESVASGLKKGWKTSSLLNFLSYHSTEPLPPDAVLTVRGWTEDFSPLELKESLMLIAPDSSSLDALLSVKNLQEYFVARISPEVALVKAESRNELAQELDKRGISLDGTWLKPSDDWKLPAISPRLSITDEVRAKPIGKLVSSTSRKRGKKDKEKVELYKLSAKENLEILRKAISQGKNVTIEYRSQKGKLTERQIEPIEIIAGGSFVRAFCLLRNQERMFKIARISRLNLL